MHNHRGQRRRKHPAYRLDKPALTRTEAAWLLDIAPKSLDRRNLPRIRLGRRSFVYVDGIMAWYQERNRELPARLREVIVGTEFDAEGQTA